MTRREISSWLMDMDGVLVREQNAVPGAQEFLGRLRELAPLGAPTCSDHRQPGS